ncbi:1811_t:CDS:2 [Funneliformis geosporum]|uniref:16466_t:CDS:1 n=1 Tax=Funneliformis geosporum TaxID=1117311 RepID=A0A9W4SEQ2_9GLOM|nr:1811_t:CDS:2 [Funneliformis geosporum]CAI2165649.1 16466_t:CDS:2 [Funneliformis geosporum]
MSAEYYSKSNNTTPQNNREPPHLLSSSFIQQELNSPAQKFSNMSENGYHTVTDQFGMHTQTSVQISEPPPYDEFVEYNWPTEIPPFLAQTPDDFNNQQLFNPEDTHFLLHDFLGNLDENDNFIFDPSLPGDMPIYPNSSDNHDSSSSHNNVYILPQGQVSSSSSPTGDLLNRQQFSSSNSTSLSPRTSSITLSSSPPLPSRNNSHNHNNISNGDGGDDISSEGGNADGSSTPTVPSKRKQENDDERIRRRTSNPRLNPINTKLPMTQSNNNSSRPISNNNSPSPSTPRELIKTKDEDDDDLLNATSANTSNIDNLNDEYSSDIKTESSTKPTPQKSSRKPYKELLTEEEKRANHIASEQKRRNTIRAGFKELTDIIPTLKNVNNSKSTILFKAVDYIKYLERRNRNLKERAGLLEMRRVAPMPINYGVIPNGGLTAIPIGHHPQPSQQQHVMAPHHQIYFVPSTPSSENPPSMIPAGSVVSPGVNSTNNIFSRGAAMGMQISNMPLSSQQNHHHPQQDNVPGMNIPTMGSDDGNSGGVDIDGDSSMLGMNGNATRVGVKC